MDIAIVTGAASGTGLVIAKKLVDLGLRVYGLGGNYSQTTYRHPDFRPKPCDLTSVAEVQQAVEEILEKEGNIFAIVNNAKYFSFKPFRESQLGELETTLQINLLVPMVLARMALPSLMKLQGFIVNISSNRFETARGGPSGAAAAGGLDWMGEALFQELRENGVKVTTIYPQNNIGRPQDGSRLLPGREPQSVINPECIADAIATIINHREGNIISELVLRPTHMREEQTVPVFRVPMPQPKDPYLRIKEPEDDTEEELEDDLDEEIAKDEREFEQGQERGKKKKRRRKKRSDDRSRSDERDDTAEEKREKPVEFQDEAGVLGKPTRKERDVTIHPQAQDPAEEVEDEDEDDDEQPQSVEARFETPPRRRRPRRRNQGGPRRTLNANSNFSSQGVAEGAQDTNFKPSDKMEVTESWRHRRGPRARTGADEEGDSETPPEIAAARGEPAPAPAPAPVANTGGEEAGEERPTSFKPKGAARKRSRRRAARVETDPSDEAKGASPPDGSSNDRPANISPEEDRQPDEHGGSAQGKKKADTASDAEGRSGEEAEEKPRPRKKSARKARAKKSARKSAKKAARKAVKKKKTGEEEE